MRGASVRSIARQQGVALLTVLWILGLLTVLAGSFSYMVRTEVQLSKNQLQATRARLLAEAGATQAIYEILLPETGRRWRFDGAENRVGLDRGRALVRVQNASGFIDLNKAPRPLLTGLFKHVGIPLEQRNLLVDRILDWRDSNDLVRLNGAEDRDYRVAGRPYGAKDADFEREDELLRVLGMTADIYARVRPYITVYSGQTGINPVAADRNMLLLLAEGNEKLVDDVILARDKGQASYQGLLNNRSAPWVRARQSDNFVVRVEAHSEGGAVAYLDLGIALATGSRNYRIAYWSEENRATIQGQG